MKSKCTNHNHLAELILASVTFKIHTYLEEGTENLRPIVKMRTESKPRILKYQVNIVIIEKIISNSFFSFFWILNEFMSQNY